MKPRPSTKRHAVFPPRRCTSHRGGEAWPACLSAAVGKVHRARARVSRFRSSPELAARSQCPDSEVRLNLRHTPVRTSESKDTGQPMILAPLRTLSSQSDLRHGRANFGFAALDGLVEAGARFKRCKRPLSRRVLSRRRSISRAFAIACVLNLQHAATLLPGAVVASGAAR